MIRAVLRSLLLLLVISLVLFASAENARSQPPASGAAATPPEALEIKSFTMATEGELTDFSQLFTALYPRLAKKEKASPTGKFPPAPAHPPRMTALPKSKTIVFRGTKAELEIAESIMKLVQGTTHEVEGMSVVKLKNARVDEVLSGLTALDLSDRVVPLRGSNTLVIVPGADAQQVKKVIELYEKAPTKSAPSPTEKVEHKQGPKPVEKVEPKTAPKSAEAAPKPAEKVEAKTAPKTAEKTEPKKTPPSAVRD